MTDPRRDITLFISVARIEATLQANKHALQRVPGEIATIDRALAALDARDKATHTHLEELAKKRRDVEKALREHEDHLKKCRSQQSLVKTNEEYTAMLKEIANLEKQIGEDEEQLLHLMDRMETAQRESAPALDAVKTERARRAGERAALETQLATLKSETEQLTRERPRVLSEITPALVKRYERIADKHEIAVTRIESEHCGVCRQQLPPQLAVEVRKNEQLINCPACGRFLVYYAD